MLNYKLTDTEMNAACLCVRNVRKCRPVVYSYCWTCTLSVCFATLFLSRPYHACATMWCPDVCLSVVCHVSIVAKRYVLPKKCLKKQVGLPDCYHVVPFQTPCDSPCPQTRVPNC